MSKSVYRLKNILKSIEDIEFILNQVNFTITRAIEDKILKPAIRMHIINISEQFNKLKEENEFEVLQKFDTKDLRGLSAIRNFIAHDYDSVDDTIIEDVLRYNFPVLKKIVLQILETKI